MNKRNKTLREIVKEPDEWYENNQKTQHYDTILEMI